MQQTDGLVRARAPEDAGPRGGYRVLHVEDDAADAALVAQLLELQDTIPIQRVDVADTKAAALARLADDGPYDVVIVDLHLPDNDDLGLVEHLLVYSPGSAVIVLTADDHLDIGVDALRRGAAEFLTKSQLDEPTLIRQLRFAVERKAYDLKLRELTSTDALTGLGNRRALEEYYETARAAVARDGSVLLLAYYDLDDFKPVNDLFGHQTGDRVLAAVAQTIRDGIRGSNAAVRLSGDEFVVAGQATDPEDARGFEERLRSLITAVPIGIGDAVVTASVGIAITDGSDELDAVLARADEEMYAQKRARH